ncbi:putative lipid II flippase FtsW [bacterium]|nr:MAG: putative lipid II flippase FtsW [bacterium]
MIDTSVKKHTIDKPLLLVVLTLLTMGVVMVYSASNVIALDKFGSSSHFLKQQFIRVILGFIILVFATKYDYHKYRSKTMLLVLISFIMLVIVLGLGQIKGAARWLQLGGFGIQPSEIAKLAIIFYLAAYLDKKGERIRDFQNGLLPPLIMAGAFCFMILIQPNFSTAAVLMLIVLAILFIGGMRIRHLGVMALVTIPTAIAVVILSPYRRARITTFLDPTIDAQGSGYQIKQSLISFANGGLTGTGVGQGKQKFLFLPEPFTDFIYSIIGEELGFIGAVFVLILFVIFLFRAMKIARTAPDLYGFYVGAGITVSIVVYALINAGVATGIFPTTGLPMPFISYGGSSLLFTCFTVGVLLNISTQTVSKEEALKRTTKEKMSNSFTMNFNVDDTTQQTIIPAEKKMNFEPVQTKRTGSRSSIVGIDLSE